MLAKLRRFHDSYDRLGSSTTDIDFFEWQFDKSAAIVNSPDNGALVGTDGDAIVCIVLGSKTPVRVGGERIVGVWQHAWFTDADHRGVGLFLMKEQIRRNAFVGVGGQNYGAAAISSAISPMVWFELRRLIAVIDVERTFELMFGKSENARRFLTTQRVARPPARASAQCFARFDGTYDDCWTEFAKELVLATDRTSTYMNWRYAEHPRFDYHPMLTMTAAGPAYFVWRAEHVASSGATVARLCEAIGARAALTEGFPVLFNELRDRQIAFVDFFCSHGPTNAALMAAGMRPVVPDEDFDLPRLFQPLANDVRKTIAIGYQLADPHRSVNFFDIDRTYFTKGDGNQDRPNP